MHTHAWMDMKKNQGEFRDGRRKPGEKALVLAQENQELGTEAWGGGEPAGCSGELER